MLEPFHTEFHRYKVMAEKALAQVSDEDMNHVPVPDGNSIGMLFRHLSGNILSRFTDFLTSDGEKPWRHRDKEFEERTYTRDEVHEMWQKAWTVLDAVLTELTPDDLTREVTIRGQALTVHTAMARSLAHLAGHVGQMILMARMAQGKDWQWISIPKGQSQQYNQNPTLERGLK